MNAAEIGIALGEAVLGMLVWAHILKTIQNTVKHITKDDKK